MNIPSRFETMTLFFPIQLADRCIDLVTIHRPTMKMLRKYPIKGAQDVEGEMLLLGALTNLRMEELEEMDAADYTRLQDVFIRFRDIPKPSSDSGGDTSPVQGDALGT